MLFKLYSITVTDYNYKLSKQVREGENLKNLKTKGEEKMIIWYSDKCQLAFNILFLSWNFFGGKLFLVFLSVDSIWPIGFTKSS